MKKSMYTLLLVLISVATVHAQEQVKQTLASFPYPSKPAAAEALSSMGSWSAANWKTLFSMLNDDSLKLQATYALDAFVHESSLDAVKKEYAVTVLKRGFSAAKTFYARELLIKEMGLLGSDVFVKTLSKLLSNELHVSSAAAALATIRSTVSIAALEAASTKAKDPQQKQILAALKSAQSMLPNTTPTAIAMPPSARNQAQQLLYLQDLMEAATNPVDRRQILSMTESIPGLPTLMFVGKQLEDTMLRKQAALIAARMALKDKRINGRAVRDILEKSLPLIGGSDSAILRSTLTAHIKYMSYDQGFVTLFNGRDLQGWKGLVGNPISRSSMDEKALLEAQSLANVQARNDWKVEEGRLVFTGHGDNLCTDKQYGDVELYVDWKITEKGDAGIYLRGSPQVQIWDISRKEVGAQVGSGGLYNNQQHPSKPLVVADNKIGDWNTFHIIMLGDKVTVYLNGVLVADQVVLENYWDRKRPIFAKEQIELQAHGTRVEYRNIYIKEIREDMKFELTEAEKKAGFEMLFDGTHLDKWVGNKTGYPIQDGAMVVDPAGGSGGNIYTAAEYADFDFRFEFQLTPGANNGLGIRSPLRGDAAYKGMELQILDNDAPVYSNLKVYQYHGSIYGVLPALRGYLKPVGEWNQQIVEAKGNKIKVTLNGQVILNADIGDAIQFGTADKQDHPGLKNKTGHIGFLGHGDVVRFRNIRVKSL